METPISSIVQQGDLGGQKVQMTFDQNSLAHLMSVLTDLYSDPQEAVIREYSTNALDAHIEAGNTDPIHVFTPSALSPYFRVKDYGIGLSINDITEMYSKYGASSKRGTNDQVGMLGLGAKSALTLVPQFTLISVKNGIKIWVSISRNSDGAGQMEIIDTAATDEPNGVEISIPVPRNHDFAAKCRDFFRFWKKGTVLLDGKEPEQIAGRPVGDKFILNKNLSQDYVVMGNVAYPCENLYSHSYSALGIVAFVNIGDVNFTPSREALQYTPKTRDTIAKLRDEFNEKLTDSVNADIDTSQTYSEAWKKAREWRASFYNRLPGLRFKGSEIPTEVAITDGKVFYLSGGRGNRYANWLRGVTPEYVNTHIFVTGFADSMKMSPVQREKVNVYAASINKNFDRVVITKEPSFQTDADKVRWMEEFTIVDWSLIAPIKVARNANGNKVMRTDPYDLYDGRYSSRQVSTLDPKLPIIYYSPSELRYPQWIYKYTGADAQVIILAKNRWDKFIRENPTAKHYTECYKSYQEDLISRLTDADKIIWHYSNYRYTIKGMEASRLDDPELHQFVEVLGSGVKFSADAQILRDSIRRDIGVPKVDTPINPFTKYPMFASMGSVDNEHMYWYLNAYYAELTAQADKEN